MGNSYLLKGSTLEPTDAHFAIPRRARPKIALTVGDQIFIWNNHQGLIGETLVTSVGSDEVNVAPITTYDEPLAPEWLTNVDREKTTIRSKLHCDRHDRLWLLSDAEVVELNDARTSRNW